MSLRNDLQGYGLVARGLHWGMALVVFAMFGLGLWMRSLDYYDEWYRTGPYIHKSVGILLLIALVARALWRVFNIRPDDRHLHPLERKISRLVHWAFYLLLLAQIIAGYLISTVDGRAISVFGWFEVPSFYQQKGLEDRVGFIHEWLAYTLMAVALMHVAAAIKTAFY